MSNFHVPNKDFSSACSFLFLYLNAYSPKVTIVTATKPFHTQHDNSWYRKYNILTCPIMWWIKIKFNVNITAAMHDRYKGNIVTLCSSKLWHHTIWQVVSECSEILISRYRIPEHECIASIYLPCNCVSESSKTYEGWAYHKQYTPKRWQQCWSLSPTTILDHFLRKHWLGWLEFFHSKACQEQRKPPILVDPASSRMLVSPVLCFNVKWLNTSNSLNEITI
jgi:hypothetical protein